MNRVTEVVLLRIDTASEDGCRPFTEQATNPQKSVEGLQGSTGGLWSGIGPWEVVAMKGRCMEFSLILRQQS